MNPTNENTQFFDILETLIDTKSKGEIILYIFVFKFKKEIITKQELKFLNLFLLNKLKSINENK